MKTVSALILTALLAACSSGTTETVTASDVVIKPQPDVYAQPDRIVTTAPQLEIVTQPDVPAAIEAPQVAACSPTTYIPCGGDTITIPPIICNPNTDASCITPEGMEYCDAWSYNPCQYPTWIPKRQTVNLLLK